MRNVEHQFFALKNLRRWFERHVDNAVMALVGVVRSLVRLVDYQAEPESDCDDACLPALSFDCGVFSSDILAGVCI